MGIRLERIKRRCSGNSEKGITLAETIVALAILAAIAVVFLGGLVVSSKAAITADAQATAESLVRSQMEWVQGLTYVDDATEYPPADIKDISDYQNYSVNITAEPVNITDDGIQRITVIVEYKGDHVITLEGFKRK